MKKTAAQNQQMQRLDQIALDIEFLLISVIQGVALSVLAATATTQFTTLQIQTWAYILAAFLFILIFWSGAIIHAVSFIDWPIDLLHSFLYFLASLVEIMAITNLTNPQVWFLFLFIFQIVAFMLYLYDLKLIKQHKKKFLLTTEGKKLYHHIISCQQKEMKLYIPISLLFNAIAASALFFYKSLFIENGYHLIFITLQIIFALTFLTQEIKTFKKRSHLLAGYTI